MKRKVFYLLALTFVVTTSCKNESATAKIDENANEIAPANPDAKPELVDSKTDNSQTLTPEQQQAQLAQQQAQLQAQQQNQQPNANVKLAEMKFNKVEHDFGTINQGDKVDYTFKFTNTGKNDLIISNAVGSCGCTVPEYPKEPVKPGKTGKIKVIFNSAGKSGQQTKTVTINANTANGTEKLTIKASINAPDKKEAVKVMPMQETVEKQ
jgi:hypothetical protein